MKYSRLLLFLLLTGGWGRVSFAQNDLPPGGARAAGMAGTAVTLSDIWSVTNNIAGITALTKPGLGVYAENRYNLKALSTASLQLVFPLPKQGALGVEIARFGDQLYNEQRFGLGYAHKIGPVQLGLKATLLQLHLEELGSKRAIAFSFGGQSEVIPKLVFGAHIYNFNQARRARFQDERFPTIMQAGLSYKPITKIVVGLEAEKNLEQPADVKAGFEYKLLDRLALRTGLSSARQSATAGVGFSAQQLQIDYALGSHSVLGLTNHLAVSYRFE